MIRRKSASLVFKLAVSMLLLGHLVRRYAGNPEFRSTLGGLDPMSFVLAGLVLLGGLCLSALRWQVLLRAAGVSMSLGRSMRLYLIGYFFNFFLPTTVGGDVMRAMGVGRGTPLPVIGGSILVERLLGFGCLLLLGIGASLTVESLAAARTVLLVSAGVYVAALLTVLFVPLPDVRREGALGRLLVGLRRTALEVRAYGFHPGALALGAVLSLAWQIALVLVNGILSAGFGGIAPAALLFALIPVIQAISMIPISFGGLGVREVGYEYFFGVSGIATSDAVALGAGFLGVTIALALLGGLVYLVSPVRGARS